jgi:dsDNA-specific endonuclease/ATPase MutS2
MKLVDWLKRIAGRESVQRSTALVDLDDDTEIDPYNPFPEPVTLEITDVIDLHTIHPKDVKRVVEEYLEQVHQAGFDSVRIVHGKGIGVQREIVRTVLARTSFVESWTDAPPDAGGLGATIVRLV